MIGRSTSHLRLVARPARLASLLRNYWAIRASDLFDGRWYLANNPDVKAAGISPVWHYLLHGALEGREPGPFFSGAGYLARNPDVKAAGFNPVLHYLRYGRHEGRTIEPKRAALAQRKDAVPIDEFSWIYATQGRR